MKKTKGKIYRRPFRLERPDIYGYAVKKYRSIIDAKNKAIGKVRGYVEGMFRKKSKRTAVRGSVPGLTPAKRTVRIKKNPIPAKYVGVFHGIIYETPRIQESKRGKFGYYHIFKDKGKIFVRGDKIIIQFSRPVVFEDGRGFLS